jgi:hypothetical protein
MQLGRDFMQVLLRAYIDDIVTAYYSMHLDECMKRSVASIHVQWSVYHSHFVPVYITWAGLRSSYIVKRNPCSVMSAIERSYQE